VERRMAERSRRGGTTGRPRERIRKGAYI
jgi:hypothetical protein